MFQLSNLIKNLENEFLKNNINETIMLRVSSMPTFDFQINNLVKFQKNEKTKNLINSFSEFIEDEPLIKNYEIAKNGFINLEINVEKFIYEIKDTKNAIKTKNPKNIILDYGGPNIGKPLHVGHLRSLNIGRSLYQINKLAGNNVINDIHLGDWGMPVAQIICYMQKNDIDLEKIRIDDLEAIYPIASKQYQEDSNFKFEAQEINLITS